MQFGFVLQNIFKSIPRRAYLHRSSRHMAFGGSQVRVTGSPVIYDQLKGLGGTDVGLLKDCLTGVATLQMMALP